METLPLLRHAPSVENADITKYMEQMKIHTKVDSPVGQLLLVAEGDALTGLYFIKERDDLGFLREGYGMEKNDADIFRTTTRQLHQYFDGALKVFDIPVRFKGTDFQKRVWSELLKIPYGKTVSYLDVAQRIGNPGAMRAVGLTNGKNPISIIYPCHRVIGRNGKLTGYGGGIDKKEWLLRHEGAWPGSHHQTSLFDG